MFCFCEVLLAFGQNTYISTELKWSTASPVKGSWAVTWHMASSKLQLAPSLRQAAQELLLPLPNTHLVDFLLVLLPREADTWQICEARSISYGSSARCSVSGRAGGAPRGSLWWERLRSGRAGGLLWSWWGNPAQGPAAPGGGGSREELRAPCLKSLAPEIAVKKNTLDVRACVSEKHGKRHCTSYGRISRRHQVQTGFRKVPRTAHVHPPAQPSNRALLPMPQVRGEDTRGWGEQEGREAAVPHKVKGRVISESWRR